MAIEINIPANGTDHWNLPFPAPFTHFAQSFQDAGGFLLDSISIGFANGAGNAGNIECSIYAADGSGFPTGDALETDTYPVSSLTTYPAYTTVLFTFTTVTISPATDYCFVITTTAGVDPIDFVYFKKSALSSYAGGHSSHYYNGNWVSETVDIISVIRSLDNPELSGTITGTSSMSGTLGLAARNPNPTNASSGMLLNWQTFSWESGSAVPPDDEVYNVYFGTSEENLELIVPEGSDINFAAAYLAAVVGVGEYSSTYYWRVDTYFQNSQETIQGDVWSFSTIAFSSPSRGGRGYDTVGGGEAEGYGGGAFGDKQINIKTRLIGFARNTLYYENL